MMQSQVDLTEQQKRCLRLVHQGLTSKEIAPKLSMSPGVVDNYILTAVHKLGASNRREAARMLAERESGLVQQLHVQPEAVAEANVADDAGPTQTETNIARHTSNDRFDKALRWLIGRFGGPPHDLTKLETVRAILWTALAATGVLACIITVGAWLNYQSP